MKVLLINPPATHIAVTSHGWMTTAEDIGAFPPIGLLYLAGALKNRTDAKIAVIDMVLEGMTIEELKVKVKEFSPDLVGITAFTPIFYDVMEVVKAVKSVEKNCHVCLGNAHVSAYPEETIEKPEIDFLLLGEGEYNFVNLVYALSKGDDLRTVDGLVFKDKDKKIIKVGKPGYIDDINAIPFPAFDLLPFDRYYSAIGTGNTVGTICSSRGCPYECTFCCKPYRTYRIRTPDNIISEMELYYNLGIREFFFFDDMFNITSQRVIDIAEAILTSGMKIIWSFRGRVDQVNLDMLKVAKKSGCRQILFGVETATDEGLRLIKKRINTKQVIEAVNLTKKMGLETNTNWIIGFAHHKSRQDVVDLIDFAIKVGSDYAQFNILIPYSGTEIFDEGVRKGVLDGDFWRNYTINPAPHALIPIWDEYLSREELSELLRMCYTRFYFRPGKILLNLTRIKNIRHLKNKIRGALVLLGLGGHKNRKASVCT